MQKFLSGLSKFLAAVFAILFVITAAPALLLYDIGGEMFGARLYKEALIELDLYERLPGLAGAVLATSASYDPCAENPVRCEDVTAELRACYERALGNERYLALAAGKEKPTGPEQQVIQACLEANPQPAAVQPRTNGMPPFLSRLEAADWAFLIERLLPPAELQAMAEQVIDQFFAYLDGEAAAVSVSLFPLKARLAGPAGIEAVRLILLTRPPCTPDELARMKGEIKTEDEPLVMCNPGEAEFPSVLPRLRERLTAAAEDIPDQVILIEPAIPSASAGPLGDSDNPITALRAIRLGLRAIPLLPLAFLLLVTLFGVRSLKGWMRWWGIPVFLAALLASGANMAITPLLDRLWFDFIAPRFPAFLPADLVQLGRSLLLYIGHGVSEKIAIHALILLLLGLGAWIGSYFVKREEETPAAPPPA